MRRLRAGLCLRCEEADHRSDACPRRDRMDGRPPGRIPGRFGSAQDTASAPTDTTLLELGTETAGDNTEHADGNAWMAKNDSMTQ